MSVLAFDQSLDKTGYCHMEYGDYVTGLLTCPSESKRGIVSAACWMKQAILQVILLVKPDAVAIEGVHLGKNVSTLIELAELRGRILSVCEDIDMPVITVSSSDVMEYLHLRVGTARKQKKERAQYIATVIVKGQPYANDGKNHLLQVDVADAVIIYEIAAARWNLERAIAESEAE